MVTVSFLKFKFIHSSNQLEQTETLTGVTELTRIHKTQMYYSTMYF